MHAGTPIHTISSDHVLHANPVKTDIFFKYETHEIDLTHLDSLFYHFSFQKGIKTKGKLVRFVLSFTSSPVQCDQMLILKVTHFFPKVAQKVATVVFSSKIVFCKKPKIHNYLSYFCKKICHQELSRIAQSGHTGPVVASYNLPKGTASSQ